MGMGGAWQSAVCTLRWEGQIATQKRLAMTDGTAFQTRLHSDDKRKAKPDRHANEVRNGTLLPYWKVKQ
jgi:hypothetical protein